MNKEDFSKERLCLESGSVVFIGVLAIALLIYNNSEALQTVKLPIIVIAIMMLISVFGTMIVIKHHNLGNQLHSYIFDLPVIVIPFSTQPSIYKKFDLTFYIILIAIIIVGSWRKYMINRHKN